MRRTVAMTNWTVIKMAESKVDFKKAFATLESFRGFADSLEFKASDVDLSGATLKVLCDFGFVKVIDKVEIWFRINEDTMKRGSANVYLFDTDVSNVFEEIKKFKIRDLERRRKNLLESLCKVDKELAELVR